MSKAPYVWTPDGPPPTLGTHSRAKHEVLTAYLQRYVQVLTVDPKQEQLRLTLVDGFSGGGHFADAETGETVHGSPLLMLHAIAEAESKAQAVRRKPFRILARFFFIERDPRAIVVLRETIKKSPFSKWLNDDRIRILQGEFVDHFDPLLQDIKQFSRASRTIFLLDQYGYSQVPFGLIQKIFTTLSYPEVILTFATDWLIDYLSDSEASDAILQRIGLKIDIPSIQRLKEDKVFEWRRIIQIALHKEIHEKSKAPFYTPFFIHSPIAHRAYWLIHFSKRSRARDVMTALHWELQNHFQHLGRPGLNMLGFDPDRDFEAQGYRVFNFDNEAEQAALDSLRADLPRVISELPGGLTFDQLFDFVTNSTPATREHIHQTLQLLSLDREIEVFSPSNKLRGRGCVINGADRIRIPKQLRLKESR